MRFVVRGLKWLGIGLAVLLVTGAVYQQIGLLLDWRPPSSDMLKLDGGAVHLACRGTGRRTIVLDAGAGAGVFEWFRLAPLLARSGRVCAFDRAGLGWSDPAGAGADALTASDRLAALVRKARIATPFVYVGHSLGANFAEVYRDRHPADVSALVLIEPGVPEDLLEDFHGSRAEAMAASDCDLTCYAAVAATALGVVRLSSLAVGHKNLDDAHRSLYRAFLARPTSLMTALASLNAAVKTAYEDLDVHGYGDTPLVVLASSDPLAGGAVGKVPDYPAWRARQLRYFASLAAKSSHGLGPVVVPDSTHASVVLGSAQSEMVARTITTFLDKSGL
jgi:pimeloyl-ACP methyl ester carboxylesterase